jgi:arylsulfatase A-like enzyme
MIEYIGSGRTDGHPFFSYVAYTAPHFPLQAPDRLIDKYKDRYLAGYEVIRKARFERMTACCTDIVKINQRVKMRVTRI